MGRLIACSATKRGSERTIAGSKARIDDRAAEASPVWARPSSRLGLRPTALLLAFGPEGKRAAPDRPRARQHGQSVVELALVVPILVLLMCGALDLGRIFYSYSGVANATRVGAAHAIDLGTLDSVAAATKAASVRAAIKREAQPFVTLGDSDIQIDALGGWVSGQQATITVTYEFPLLVPYSVARWATPGEGNNVKFAYVSKVRFR